jgi:hypothetical protein
MHKTQIHAGNGVVDIDSRTIVRLDTEPPSIGTADRTDGREGWCYYGIDTDGDPWTWIEYNADGVAICEADAGEVEDYDIDMLRDIATEIDDRDPDHAAWLREMADRAESDTE